ncbi:protein FAM98B [Paramormyrops kingsleyae]|uniref:protein FAM98B n=1 Tax=Paramormyrops kingsleyae TaxID=1676925 RepID=UPI003B97775D
MEYDILDTLEQLGYDGPLTDEHVLAEACDCGLSSPAFAGLIVWMTVRLAQLLGLEESVCIDENDADGLQSHISRLLKEMLCPYPALLEKEALQKKENCLNLILYLSSELQAAQIVESKQSHVGDVCTTMQNLKSICQTLKLSEPNGQSTIDIISHIEAKIKEICEDLPKQHLGKPVLKLSFNSEQWGRLEQINSALSAEYEHRRRMLIKRLDVTVQSFSWSERAKNCLDRMAKVYQPLRYSLLFKPSISLGHLLAAREDICHVMKTSSGQTREKTACAINKILMGSVPDRGGRPSEIDAPPPEMPPWQKRQDFGGRGGWDSRERGRVRTHRNFHGGRGGSYGGRARHYFY